MKQAEILSLCIIYTENILLERQERRFKSNRPKYYISDIRKVPKLGEKGKIVKIKMDIEQFKWMLNIKTKITSTSMKLAITRSG